MEATTLHRKVFLPNGIKQHHDLRKITMINNFDFNLMKRSLLQFLEINYLNLQLLVLPFQINKTI